MKDYDQTLQENLSEIQRFLYHIEGRVGEGAFNRVCSVLDEAVKQSIDPDYLKATIAKIQSSRTKKKK